jgi:hypothetical protein
MSMNIGLFRTALAGLAVAAVGISTFGSSSPAFALPPQPGAPVPQVSTPPPLSATATPSPSGQLIKYSAQLLDYRKGYVVFTTGDAFRAASPVKIDDAKSGGPTLLQPQTRVFARASFDTGNGSIVELALSTTPLPPEASYQDIARFRVLASAPTANPDLGGGGGFDGRPAIISFTVTVPPKTPFGDSIYLSTDISGWSPTAIKMDRIDANRYRVSREYPSGTKFHYRYTRGSTQTVERTADGQEVEHAFVVNNVTSFNKEDVVSNWADQNENQVDNGAAPGAIPTPFNPIPFVTPPGRPHR